MKSKYPHIKEYLNGHSFRLENKRISVFSEDKEIVKVQLQAILPETELNFYGNFIRKNYKQTAFSLSKEAAIGLFLGLKDTLIKMGVEV